MAVVEQIDELLAEIERERLAGPSRERELLGAYTRLLPLVKQTTTALKEIALELQNKKRFWQR